MNQGSHKHVSGHEAVARTTLSGLEGGEAIRLLTAASDVVLFLRDDGVIRDLAFGSDELVNLGCADWEGQPWSAVVTVESRPKVASLLKDALAGKTQLSRQVNHPTPTGSDLPVTYRVLALPLADGAHQLVALGRDLRAEMALQQRLVSAQVSMERDYWRLRHVETRYRLLFQQAAEPVLILDAATEKLEEANPAAQVLFGDAMRKASWSLTESFEAAGAQAVRDALVRVRASGRVDPISVRLARGAEEFQLSISLLRHENSSHFLLRLTPAYEPVRARGGAGPQLSELVQEAPDAYVVTDPDGRVLYTNRAFVELAQAAAEDVVRGESLDRWLGRSGVDLNVLISNLRQHGAVRLFATQLRGELGSVSDVEISAVTALSAEPACFGFTIRDIGRRLLADGVALRELPRSPGQMTELVGRMPLKDIVRDTTDLIEQMCIEAALKLTHDNRASAAEMLGLSRQSLYVKLRRFGLIDSSSEDE